MKPSLSLARIETPAGLLPGTALLLFILLLIGGGGSPAPLMQAVLETLAFCWLLYVLWTHFFVRRLPNDGFIPAFLLLAMLLLAAIQLIPLPYSIWRGLPGRALAVEALNAAGLGTPAMPISLFPEDTRLAALQLLAPAAVLFGALAVNPAERLQLARVLILVALLSAVLAAFQFAAPGTRSLYIFSRSVYTVASGIFANRNLQPDLLLLGILLLAFEARMMNRRREETARFRRLAWLGTPPVIAIAFLSIMALATLSRAGAMFLAPTLLVAYIIASDQRLRLAVPIGLAGTLAVGGLLAFSAPRLIDPILGRFGGSPEGRFEALPDLSHAAASFWPLGSGIGTFVPIFRISESLELVQQAYWNHAHNEYLEIMIEAGLPGLALVAIFFLAFLVRAFQVLRSSSRSPYADLQRVAVIGMALLLSHSALDYPLRTITLSCAFAFLSVILFTRDPGTSHRRRGRR